MPSASLPLWLGAARVTGLAAGNNSQELPAPISIFPVVGTPVSPSAKRTRSA